MPSIEAAPPTDVATTDAAYWRAPAMALDTGLQQLRLWHQTTGAGETW
jgi:hypothetical protein